MGARQFGRAPAGVPVAAGIAGPVDQGNQYTVAAIAVAVQSPAADPGSL